MKKIITTIGMTIGLMAATAQADVACIATDMASLKTALTTGNEGKPCALALVANDITATEPLNVPAGTTLLGFIENHPFLQTKLHFKIEAPTSENTYCALTLGKGSGLVNLMITTETQFKNAVCINESSAFITRTSIDAPFVNGFIRGILMTSGSGVLSDNTISTVRDGIISGNNASIFFRNRIFTRATGEAGITFTVQPLAMSGNELLGEAKLQLPHNPKLSMGTAANIIKLNNLIGTSDDGSDRSNFYELYNIFPKFLKPCDAPIGYAPYNEDGSCKTYVFGKTDTPVACPLNQVKLANGACGCPDAMKLDTTSNLCFQEKVVEKVIEKIVEKPVEKIVEKPGADISKNGMQPIVANPASDGGSCSLSRTTTAAIPVLAFLAIITLTGIIAYRTRPQAARVCTKKERRHD